MVSKIQWKPFWLATELCPQNDWTGWQNGVNDDVRAQAPCQCAWPGLYWCSDTIELQEGPHIRPRTNYYPGQKKKKRTIIEISGEKNAVPRVISCSIRHDQRRASPIRDCPRLLPCADCAWSSMISHVEQRSSRRESRGWFFFLSRVGKGPFMHQEREHSVTNKPSTHREGTLRSSRRASHTPLTPSCQAHLNRTTNQRKPHDHSFCDHFLFSFFLFSKKILNHNTLNLHKAKKKKKKTSSTP